MTRAAGGSIDKENFVIVRARNTNVPAGQQRKIQEREEDDKRWDSGHRGKGAIVRRYLDFV